MKELSVYERDFYQELGRETYKGGFRDAPMDERFIKIINKETDSGKRLQIMYSFVKGWEYEKWATKENELLELAYPDLEVSIS